MYKLDGRIQVCAVRVIYTNVQIGCEDSSMCCKSNIYKCTNWMWGFKYVLNPYIPLSACSLLQNIYLYKPGRKEHAIKLILNKLNFY